MEQQNTENYTNKNIVPNIYKNKKQLEKDERIKIIVKEYKRSQMKTFLRKLSLVLTTKRKSHK